MPKKITAKGLRQARILQTSDDKETEDYNGKEFLLEYQL